MVFRWHDRYELVDGFKRLAAARAVREVSSLWARVIEADERSAKAALYSLNRVSGKPSELEEAWIVHALVRDDGLPQVEVAELLGRHKSWVCRRLALIERLEEAAQAELKVGLLSPTCARQLVRLPPGNQDALLAVIRREALTAHEVAGDGPRFLEALVRTRRYGKDEAHRSWRCSPPMPEPISWRPWNGPAATAPSRSRPSSASSPRRRSRRRRCSRWPRRPPRRSRT
jgi:hypothetical protein